MTTINLAQGYINEQSERQTAIRRWVSDGKTSVTILCYLSLSERPGYNIIILDNDEWEMYLFWLKVNLWFTGLTQTMWNSRLTNVEEDY